jgi:3-oxoacyl-[acyl-carrier-protein] synthase-1
LETESEVKRRNINSYAKFLGWGQGSDGHNVAISHPEGRGLQSAMRNALKDAGLAPTEIDYVNAHAPSTTLGDASEMKALKKTFPLPQEVLVSSTKPLTGHGLSLSSIMEAAFCCVSLKDQFLPGSAHVKNPDPELGHLKLLRESKDYPVSRIMSNSSGFGGANVSLVFEKV